jgi:uncharacterized protein YegP (UPF0339 family)
MFMRAASFSFALCVAGLVGLTSNNEVQAAQDKGDLKFEIYEDNAKEFRWRLKAANGKVLATPGQGYKAKADCKKAIDRIKSDVASDKLKFEVYEDNKKEYRWRLKAANGQVIGASSEGYKAKSDCEKATEEIKKGAAKAEVEEK